MPPLLVRKKHAFGSLQAKAPTPPLDDPGRHPYQQEQRCAVYNLHSGSGASVRLRYESSLLAQRCCIMPGAALYLEHNITRKFIWHTHTLVMYGMVLSAGCPGVCCSGLRDRA